MSTIMQAPRDDLLPPKEDPFTQEALKAYDGSDPDKPVYVAIKGTSSVLVSLSSIELFAFPPPYIPSILSHT